MIHDPPRTAIVTAKTYQKQPGNKITGLAGILLPVLLPVFFLKTNQVTGGNENDWLSRHLNAREIVYGFTRNLQNSLGVSYLFLLLCYLWI